jgi:outer membrane protein OmpA-like peptidoglycan-associated protein
MLSGWQMSEQPNIDPKTPALTGAGTSIVIYGFIPCGFVAVGIVAASLVLAGPAAAQSPNQTGRAPAASERVIGTFHLRPSEGTKGIGQDRGQDRRGPDDGASSLDPPLTNVGPRPPSSQPSLTEDATGDSGHPDALDILQAALTAMKVGEDAQARDLLRRVVEIAPGSPEANRAQRHLRELGVEEPQTARVPEMPPANGQPIPGVRRAPAQDPRQKDRLQSYEQDFISIAGDRVFFGLGSSKLGGRARRVLASQAQWLSGQRDLSMIIEGHADDGAMAPEQQQAMAKARADAVYNRLVQEGVDPRRLQVQVLGRRQPVAQCSDQACSAQNRRVISVLQLTPGWDAIPATAQRLRPVDGEETKAGLGVNEGASGRAGDGVGDNRN